MKKKGLGKNKIGDNLNTPIKEVNPSEKGWRDKIVKRRKENDKV